MAHPALFDACATIGRDPHGLLADYAYYGIGAAVVYHAQARGDCPDRANRLLLEQVANRPALIPQWVVMPHGDGRMAPADELVPELLERGVRSARICPRTHGFPLSDDVCGPLWSALQEQRLPLFADVGEVGLGAAADLCARYPALPVVLCGLTWNCDRSLFPALERCPNLHVETHALFGHHALRRISGRFGAGRLIFGTGLPDWSPGAPLGVLMYADISQQDRAAIAGGNLLRLLRAADCSEPLPDPAPPGVWEDDDPIVVRLRLGEPLSGELVLDAHGHIGHEGSSGTTEWCLPHTDADSLVRTMDRLGVDRVIVSSWGGLMLGDPESNNVVLRALARHPGRLLGYACINPRYPETMRGEIQRLLASGRLHGYKPYAPRHGVHILDLRHRPILECCDRRGLPVLCHGWLGGPQYVTPEDLDRLAPMYPGAHFVSAHVGGSWEFARALVPVMRRHPNIYADVAYPSTPHGIIEFLVREAGADRVVYGSDGLLIDPASQLGWVGWARLSIEDKRKLLGLNLARFLGIPAAH